jgi:hypothetical protein
VGLHGGRSAGNRFDRGAWVCDAVACFYGFFEMNIKQVEKDFQDGIMLSKVTVGKLIQAAALMERTLTYIGQIDAPREVGVAVVSALDEVREL